MNIGLIAENRYTFSKKVAKALIEKKVEAEKHYWKWCEKNGISEGYANKGYAKENYEPIIERLKTQEGQEETLRQFLRIKKAIKQQRLLLACEGGLSWSVAIVAEGTIEGIELINQKALCSYPMNYNKRAYTMGCYGTSRPLEIILAYGHNLGLKSNKIPQRQQIR